MARHLKTAAMMSVLTIDAAIKNKMAAYRLRITEEERQAQWQAGLQNIAKQMMSNAKAGENDG